VFLKVGLTILCSGLIGIERELTSKPAGMRTNMLISIGSCLMMILSIEVAAAAKIGDPGRIAAQVVTGIGFLGAGTIIQSRGIPSSVSSPRPRSVSDNVASGAGAGIA